MHEQAEPDERPTQKSTESEEEAAREGAWMAQNWIAVAVVSILALVLLALGMLQATGLVDVMAPIADYEVASGPFSRCSPSASPSRGGAGSVWCELGSVCVN